MKPWRALDALGIGSRAAGPAGAGAVIVLGLVLAGAVGGCAAKRPAKTQEELVRLREEDRAAVVEMHRRAVERVVERVAGRCGDYAAGRTKEPPVVNALAISGGGDWGAFGAGFLVGWGSVTDPSWRRPEFDMVSGVSTGALIAPFAYLGTDADYLAVEEFYRNPKPDWVQPRRPLPFLPWMVSFMAIPGLERDIDAVASGPFVERLVAESRKGKLLLVSATNVDTGEQRYWDVAAEAQTAAAEHNPERVDRILRASAAIPAVFPPVQIGEYLYADGGVTANVLVRLDWKTDNGFLKTWQRLHPELKLPKIRYWIIMNNQFAAAPQVTEPTWPAITGVALGVAIRSATRSEIALLAALAEGVNATHGTDVEVRVVAVPDDWTPPVKGDFQKETMAALADMGRRMGADPGSWRVLVGPGAEKPR